MCNGDLDVSHHLAAYCVMETSLRSRPSKAPPRKAQRTPTKLAKSGASQRNKNRIDDKIKKRISTRYAEISSPTQLSGVPAIPTMMGLIPAGQEIVSPQEGDEDLRDRSDIREEARAVVDDKKLLSIEDFDPAACESPFSPFPNAGNANTDF